MNKRTYLLILFVPLVLLSTGFALWSFFDETSNLLVYESNSDAFKGPTEELAMVESFPYGQYQIYTVPRNGSFYLDSPKDCIKDVLRRGECWEPMTKGLIEKCGGLNSTMVDIGAHIGTHTLTMSKAVGKKGKVIAFEPQKKIFKELVQNLKLNHIQNVTVYRCALGDASKPVQMYPTIFENEGATGIGSGGEDVAMLTLDAFKLDGVSFIKIDVENEEAQVLRGAKETIARNRPIILVSIMGNSSHPIANREKSMSDTLALIAEMGYIIQHFNWSDYLATPIEKMNL